MHPDPLHRQLRLDVSVVSGANEDLVFGCLQSLFDTTRTDGFAYRVTVTCNTPGTGLASRLRARFPQVRLIENAVTKSFASNHNAVLRNSAGADYVLVMNDDLVFLEGAVAAAIQFLERKENRRVGVLTPQLLNRDGSIQPCTFSFPTVPRALLAFSGIRDRVATSPRLFWLARFLGRANGRSRFWAHDRVCDVDTFAGAAMFVRGSALNEVGLMEEVSQVGGEETEWHRRFWNRGWRVVFFPDARVIHYEAQTVTRDPLLASEFFKGWANYFRRHRSRAVYRVLLLTSAGLFALRWALAAVRHDGLTARQARMCLGTARDLMRVA